jgi:hypothetical protein
MKKIRMVYLSAAVIAAVFLTMPAHPKDNKKAAQKTTESTVYGMVMAFNKSLNAIKVMYYVPEADTEKALVVYLNKNTAIENASGPEALKKGTLVNITYISNAGVNIARRISVEKKRAGEGEIEEYFNTNNESD